MMIRGAIVPRYTSHIDECVSVLSEGAIRSGSFSPSVCTKLNSCATLSEFSQVVQRDVEFSLTCASARSPESPPLEGAHAVLVDQNGGISFTLRSVMTEKRVSLFEQELDAAFSTLLTTLRDSKSSKGGQEDTTQLLLECFLRIFYYWCQYAPLSTLPSVAFVGLLVLEAVALSAGYRVVCHADPHRLLSVSARLCEDGELWYMQMKRYIHLEAVDCNVLDLPPVWKNFSTLRSCVHAVHAFEPRQSSDDDDEEEDREREEKEEDK